MGGLEEEALCLLGELLGLAFARMDRLLDLLGRAEQAPQQRVLLDDPRVVAGVAGGRDLVGEALDLGAATGGVELAGLREELGDGERVDRLVALIEGLDRLVDEPVALAVEVVTVQADVGEDGVQRRRGDHHRAEDRALGVEVLGRDVDCGFGCFHRNDPRWHTARRFARR